MSLTPKQELFCQHYLLDLNATRAAIRAGYSEATAQEQGSRLLSRVMVSTRVHELIQARSERLRVDADWVLRQLIAVVERCAVPQQQTVMTGAGLVQVTDPATGEGVFEFDAIGATRALELLGKHVGLFERHNNKQQRTKVVLTIGGKAPLMAREQSTTSENLREPEET